MFQLYVDAPLAVKFAEVPEQSVLLLAVIVTFGSAVAITVLVFVLVHPKVFEPITV